MADRRGEADALAVRKMLEWLASPPCRPEAPGALAAFNRLTARLSEAERDMAQMEREYAKAGEEWAARLSDYEQALRDIEKPASGSTWVRDRARAALSGSTRPDDASV